MEQLKECISEKSLFGNTGRLYVDGWAEFERKIDAKTAALKMNGNMAGLPGRWQYDIWTVRYLPGFKWVHLEQELDKEREETRKKRTEETAKAEETAKKWLKQTKSAIASGKPLNKKKQLKSKKEHQEDAEYDDDADYDNEVDTGDEDADFTTA